MPWKGFEPTIAMFKRSMKWNIILWWHYIQFRVPGLRGNCVTEAREDFILSKRTSSRLPPPLISNSANSATNYYRYESLFYIFFSNKSSFEIKTYFQAFQLKKKILKIYVFYQKLSSAVSEYNFSTIFSFRQEQKERRLRARAGSILYLFSIYVNKDTVITGYDVICELDSKLWLNIVIWYQNLLTVRGYKAGDRFSGKECVQSVSISLRSHCHHAHVEFVNTLKPKIDFQV
jgi:hypothetical protein